MSDLSRVEDILDATIKSEPYDEPPQSRVEEKLVELKKVIEEGGGGGGSVVSITPTLESGTKIADYSINGSEGELYAPTPSAGSTTLSGLTDVDLSSPTDGQGLVYDEETGKWVNSDIGGGGGGVAVSELTQDEYNDLTEQQKKNGNIYLTHDGGYDFISYDNGKIIVRVNATTDETLWFFNGFTKEADDLDIPEILVDYLPTQTAQSQIIQAKSWTDDTSSETNGWIGFVYPGTNNVKIRSWSSNFNSLIAGTFWAVLDINGSTEQGGQTSNYYEPTEGLTIVPNRMYYNGTLYSDVGGGGSSSLDQCTLPEYNALTQQQKMDGTARFIPASNVGETSELDCTDITGYYENHSVMDVSASSDSEIDITYSGGVQIGCNFKFNDPIDVTDWDKITFKVLTGSCYGGGSTAQQARWDLQVGLLDFAITQAMDIPPTDSRWKAVVDMPKANNDYGEVELDVSELTGELYLTCVCHGWNAVLEDFTLATNGGYSSRIMYMGEAYGMNEGSGESYTETVLYTNSGTSLESITLSDDFTNYDELYFDIYRHADNTDWHIGKSFLTSLLSVGDDLQILVYNLEYESWGITDTKTFTYSYGNGTIYVKNVIGIKYGSGSGGGSGVRYIEEDDYDDLPQATKLNGTAYFVKGGESEYDVERYEFQDGGVILVEHNQDLSYNMWYLYDVTVPQTKIDVPNDLLAYVPNFGNNQGCYNINWISETQSENLVGVAKPSGYNSPIIGIITTNWASWVGGIANGVIDMNGPQYSSYQNNKMSYPGKPNKIMCMGHCFGSYDEY